MNHTVLLNVEGVGSFGQGLGKDTEGNVYFVHGALPGDKVLVRYQETHKRYRDAEIVELTEKSKDRVSSPCVAFPECGGCDWLNWDYPAQLRAKEETIQHVLDRASLKVEKRLPIIPSPKIFGYRNRVQVRQEGNLLGFYRKKTHEIVEVKECVVADPRLNEKFSELRAEAGVEKRKVELFVGKDGKVQSFENAPHASEGFEQINPEQNENLKKWIADAVARLKSKRVLELYCGDGNLTFSAAAAVEEWIGVDSNQKAIDRGKLLRGQQEQQEHQGQGKASFFCTEVDRRLLVKLPAEFIRSCDTLILDPPREGTQGAMESLIPKSVKNIIYVSCAPLSFAADTQALQGTFALRELQPFDMFPHTRHVELVARFERV